MNLIKYIEKYGEFSFSEKPFNEVDAVLFSFLSYVDFSKIVFSRKISIKNVGNIHFDTHSKKEKAITAVRDATKVLNKIKDTKRYGSCFLYNYERVVNKDIQFSAISIEYQKNRVFVSFEGTNEMISGWRENLILGYSFPTATHLKAIEYVNNHFTFALKKIILGGHSKGGNLALVAAMCSRSIVRAKISSIYNVDGPGLLQKEFESPQFKRIIPRYHHIIPHNSVVGIILYNTNEYVVQSTVVGPLSHDVLYWDIENNHFVKSRLCSFSKELGERLLNYLSSYSVSELKSTIKNLDKVCQKANIDSLLDFRNDVHNITNFILACHSLDVESRNMVYDLLNIIIRSIGDSKYRDFMQFVKKFKLDI